MALNLAGCYTALITPFTADGSSIDQDRLRAQIKFQATGKVAGVVPCGTTGESPTLSADEWRSVVADTVAVAKPLGLTVIAGTGSNSTAHAVELQKQAADLGADAGLSVSPYYNKPTAEGLYRHFMAVADAAELPVVVYNIPGRSGVALTPDTFVRLAAHPNIVAVKDATGSLDMASEVAVGTDLTVLSGDDTLTLPMAVVGAKGVISVVSNMMPRRVSDLCNAFNSERWDEARTIHFQLFRICRALLTLETNPIPIKTALRILGRDSGALRLPMCEAREGTVAAIEALVRDLPDQG